MKKSILIMMGPPGVGKGTLASRFENRMDLTTVSTGQLFRENVENKTELGLKVKSIINSGVLVSDDLVNEVFEIWFDSNWDECKTGILLDGYPRSLNQAFFLISFLNKKSILKDAIVCLVEAQDQVILERISGRLICSKSQCGAIYSVSADLSENSVCPKCGSSLVKRKDDDSSCAQIRLKEYRQYKSELILHFQQNNMKIISVDTANKNPEEVFESFKILLSN